MRVSYYRAVPRRPGVLTIDRRFLQGLADGVEVSAATVEVVAAR